MSIIGQSLDNVLSKEKETDIFLTFLPFLLILPLLLYYYIKSTYHCQCERSLPSIVLKNANLLAKYLHPEKLLEQEAMLNQREGKKKENHLKGVCFCQKIDKMEVEGKERKIRRKKNRLMKKVHLRKESEDMMEKKICFSSSLSIIQEQIEN